MFFDGGAQIGSGTLVNGVATAPVAFGTVGTHNVTAAYSGGAGFNAVTSAVLPQVVADFSFAVASTTQTTW